MINRTRVSFVAAFFIILLSTGMEASARGAGGVRAGGFHGGFHGFAVRPAARIAPFHHRVGGHAVAHRRFGAHHRHGIGRHHRNKFGDVAPAIIFVPSTDDWGYGLTPYASPPVSTLGAAEPAGPAEAVSALAAAGVMCRSTVQTVARELGGHTQVRVTRCYPPAE